MSLAIGRDVVFYVRCGLSFRGDGEWRGERPGDKAGYVTNDLDKKQFIEFA